MIQTPGGEIANRLATLQALLATHDVDAAIVRQMNLMQAADDRVERFKFLAKLSRIGGMLRFWR